MQKAACCLGVIVLAFSMAVLAALFVVFAGQFIV